ncbi:MAG TPA: hypothetical protein VGK01_19840 [Candidatus Angelobacter sp.]
MRPPFQSARTMLIVICLGLAFLALSSFGLATNAKISTHAVSGTPAADPDKAPSELNHHIAGLLLIAIGLSVLLSEYYTSLAWLRWLSPVLFIAAGIFLAAWSDNEIWPRGALNWSWLVHHDAEARQHKLYALLLTVIGAVEGLKLVPRFRRQWLTLVFPVLGVIGGIALLFHNHGSEVVMVQPVAASSIAPEHDHSAAGMAMHGLDENHHATMPDSAAKMAAPHSHEHHMNATMEKIQREHSWFVVVGIFVVLFKFMYDSSRSSRGLPFHLWASSMMLLGCLLLMYTE